MRACISYGTRKPIGWSMRSTAVDLAEKPAVAGWLWTERDDVYEWHRTEVELPPGWHYSSDGMFNRALFDHRGRGRRLVEWLDGFAVADDGTILHEVER